jgi:hypothetical protein
MPGLGSLTSVGETCQSDNPVRLALVAKDHAFAQMLAELKCHAQVPFTIHVSMADKMSTDGAFHIRPLAALACRRNDGVKPKSQIALLPAAELCQCPKEASH